MEKYIGVKILHAEPMTAERAGAQLGRPIDTKNADTEGNGYMVHYEDGYTSWSPKDQFESAYRKTSGMTFGLAIEATGKGFSIEREGWNGKGMHVTRYKLYTPDNIQINNDCLLLFNVDKKYNTWVPSITDILADDWKILK